ncbi:MAG TPA: hypothetical protein VIA98_10945 [Allosphingosinicella sp.]|jgi:hypothetical protein
MIRIGSAAAILTIGFAAAQPCAAAEDIRDSAMRERHASAFGGLSLRVPFGGSQAGKPSARLQFAAASTTRDPRSGSTSTRRADGLEIVAGDGGKPALHLSGRSTAEMKSQLGMSKSTTTIIVVGGVVLLLLVVLAASQVPPQPDFDD